ncbi:MAG: hypothetical protein U0271_05790 [Polyangiaceae bacterium]
MSTSLDEAVLDFERWLSISLLWARLDVRQRGRALDALGLSQREYFEATTYWDTVLDAPDEEPRRELARARAVASHALDAAGVEAALRELEGSGDDLTEEATKDRVSAPSDPTLPFRVGNAAPPRAATQPQREELGDTSPIAPAAGVLDDTLPFDRQRDRDRALTLSGYVELVTALAFQATHREVVFATWNMTEAKLKALGALWEARFAAEPSLRKRFNEHVEIARRAKDLQRSK